MDLLTAMRMYIRVVERGSMSKAAHDLAVTQPSVSQRIERLEQHLGVRLLHRSTRALTCTDEGHAFYVHSKQVLEAVETAYTAITRDERVVRGTLRIAAPQCVGEVVLPPILLHVRELYPDLRIEVVLNDRIVDPITEGVDISLRLGPPGVGNFFLHRIGHLQRRLVAAPAYLEREGPIEQPSDLIKHPFIHVAGLFSDGHLPLSAGRSSTVHAPLNVVMTTSHWRPMYEMLLSGAGIGVVQYPACAEALADGRLASVLPHQAVPSFECSVLVAATRPVPPRTRAVLGLLQQALPAAIAQPAGMAGRPWGGGEAGGPAGSRESVAAA